MTYEQEVITKFTLNPAVMNEMLRGPDGMVVRDLILRATRVQLAAQQQVRLGHVHAGRTNYGQGVGNLRNSIMKRVIPLGASGPSVLVGSDDPVALIVHEGAKPHIIRPRSAKVLVFWMNNQQVITRRVNHPGTKPNRYLTDNLHYAIV